MNKYVKTLFSIIIAGFLFIACEPVNEPRLLPALGDEPLSKEFCVSVNGVKAAVEKMAKLDIPIHYTQVVCNGKASMKIVVTVQEDIQSYRISPLRKGIQGEVVGNELTFTVDGPGFFVVKINNMEDLYLLINPFIDYQAELKNQTFVNIKDYDIDSTGNTLCTEKIQQAIDETAKKGGVLYFPKGIYRTGQLNMRSNLSLFLADDALLMGSVNPNDYQEKCLIRIDSVDHFRILGYGTIDGAGWSGLRKNGAREFYLVYASNCKDIVFDGVVLRDPTFWNTRVYRSEQVHFRNLKVLNNRPVRNWTNTDGIDFDSSKDCSLINAVIHAGDDNVVVKGLDNERVWTTENILFDRILTMSNSAAAKIGTETCVKKFSNITFSNIDVMKCKRAMVINAFDSTHIEKVRFENFYIQSFEFPGNEAPRLIDFEITNKSWRECTGNSTIDGVEVKNIHILSDMDGVESQILGKDAQYCVRNVNITGCTVQGKPISVEGGMNLKINEFVK